MRRKSSLFEAKTHRKVAFEFVLDALSEIDVRTRPMFGCTAIYLGEKIVMALRDKNDADSGVWIATTREHHASLHSEIPSLRGISLFGTDESAWRNIPSEGDGFEEDALAACALVLRADPRIGKTPAARRISVKKPAKKP